MTVATLNSITSVSSNITLFPLNVQVSKIQNMQTTSLHVVNTTPTPISISSTFLTTVAFDLNVGNNMITPEMKIIIREQTSIRLNIDISRISFITASHNNYRRQILGTQVFFSIVSSSLLEASEIQISLTLTLWNSILSNASNNLLQAHNFYITSNMNTHMISTTPTPSPISSTYSTIVAFDLNIGNNTITPEMQIKIRNEISMRMNIDISRIGSLVIVYNETTGTTQVQFTITSVLQ